jgi:chaperonin GroEL
MREAEQRMRVQLTDPSIVISDLELDELYDVVPLLELIKEHELANVVIMAKKMSERVIATIITFEQQSAETNIIPVKLPGPPGEDAPSALADLAALTGGRPLLSQAGDRLRGVKMEDLGQARRMWADADSFGIVAGKGDPRALRRHIANLRAAFHKTEDLEHREVLQTRIGKLLGGSATLWIGGLSKVDIDEKKESARKASFALRGAVREGVLPGGGYALLASRQALLPQIEASEDSELRAAYKILYNSLEAPTRAILSNAGINPSQWMAEIERGVPQMGFDVINRKMVNLHESGLLDITTTIKSCVHAAIASAALALTIELIVHPKRPEIKLTPE